MKETIKNAVKAIKKTVKSITKGFKAETIQKAIDLQTIAINHYMRQLKKGIKLKIAVSKDNRKIGKVINVSQAPIITCGKNAKYCKHFCYDLKAVLQYPSTLLARARNTAIARFDLNEYFNQIEDVLQRRQKNFYFRWHVGGDIPSGLYFAKMVELANKYPHFVFWTYTKKYWIVNHWIKVNGQLPNNLTVMFSQWKERDESGNIKAIPFDNPYNMPIFTVRFDEEEKPNLYKCPGNCDICKQLNRGCIAGESTYNDAH